MAKAKAKPKAEPKRKTVRAKRGAVNQKVNKVRPQGKPKREVTPKALHRKMESPREVPIFYGLFIP